MAAPSLAVTGHAVKDVSATANLLALQSRIKCDPQGYEDELLLQLRHFEACLSVFQLHSSNKSSFVSDQNAAKELADMTMFLAHVTPFYPKHLSQFPKQILGLLQSMGDTLQPALRRQLTQALILLRNRQMIELVEILPVLMELQTLGDRNLRKLASLHIVQDIRRMNLKHRNESKNRALQNVMFQLLQDDNECRSKRALIVVCELHRRKLWVDERTVNAICNACFHNSSRILKCTLAFLLGYENVDDEDEDESSDEEAEEQKPCVSVSREAIYKAHHKGTASSRRKKQAKLQRVIRSLKKQQRSQADATSMSSSPLQHLHDPQGFAEKLFSRLQNCNERFEVKLMMMKIISRAIGLHRLIVLNFYPFLQKYVQPHQREVTHVLAAAVQACHDMVPPDAVETLLRQLVNQFVHDRARPEVIAVGLNVVREMCARMPLIMTRELLHDLALYKKSREKAVSSAARSIIAVFRQVCPTLLEKRDRGKGADLHAMPTAFGEKVVPSNVPGVELLTANDENESDDLGSNSEIDNSDSENDAMEDGDQNESCDEENEVETETEGQGEGDTDEENEDEMSEDGSDVETFELDSDENLGSDQSEEEDDDDEDMSFGSEDEAEAPQKRGQKRDGSDLSIAPDSKRRKLENVNTDSLKCSLRELKKMVVNSKNSNNSSACDENDGILSNEDFERIKRLKAKKAIREAMAEHGLAKSRKKDEVTKIPNLENIHERRVNPASLEANVRRRREKDERIASVRAGQEDREAYKSRASVKQKKTGGLSNRQKEKKKNMPLAAKMAKASKSRNQKKARRKLSNQFRGRKAWK